MRWTILIMNLSAVIALQLLAAYATAAHQTPAFSTYRTLVDSGCRTLRARALVSPRKGLESETFAQK